MHSSALNIIKLLQEAPITTTKHAFVSPRTIRIYYEDRGQDNSIGAIYSI